jgi:hypothetical protein
MEETAITSHYKSDEMYNLIYNLMMLDKLRDVHIPYMEQMKEFFKQEEEFEKCENIKNFLNNLKDAKQL